MGILVLFTNLRGKDFILLTLNVMLVVGLSYMAFIILRYNSIPTMLRVFFFFLSWADVKCSQILCLRLLRRSYDFPFHSINGVCHIYQFVYSLFFSH